MVFVTVGNDKCLYTINVFNDVRIVWDDIVDSEKIVFGEFNTRIDDDNLILVFNTIGFRLIFDAMVLELRYFKNACFFFVFKGFF